MALLIKVPSKELFFYHLDLLFDQALIDGQNLSASEAFVITGITWKGHDFLDSIRKDVIWKRVLKKLASVGGAASLEIVVQLAKQQVKESLGLKE